MLKKSQLAERRFFLLVIASLAALGPLSIDMYLPTLPDLASDMGVPISSANLTVSFFMFGMAIGQLFGGPLSDQLGRKTVGMLGLSLHIFATFLIVNSNSIEAIQKLRILQAIGGGFCSVICMAQARDVFPPEKVTRKFANIIMVILVAPMIAPTLGAVIAPYGGWRAVFILLGSYAALVFMVYVLLIPETHENNTGKLALKPFFKNYLTAITNRTNGRLLSLRFAIFSGFSSGILFTYVTNASFIFIEYYQLSTFQFTTVFGVLVAMMMAGNRASAYFLTKSPAPVILAYANAMQILVSAALMLYCIQGEPSVWATITGLSILIIGNGAISPVAGGHYISLFTENIGSASSFNASTMFAFGSIIGGIAAVLSNGELTPIIAVMFISSLCARILLWSTKE